MTMAIIMRKLSKSQFKSKALEIMRQVELTGESVLITGHGRPVLELKTYPRRDIDPFEKLRGSVLDFQQPTGPLDDGRWKALR